MAYVLRSLVFWLACASFAAKGYGSPLNSFIDAFSGGTHRIEAFVDNPRPYVNEQMTYTFRYLYSARIASPDAPQYTPPPLEGFWTKELPKTQGQRQVIDGTSYWIVEMHTALFPMAAGKLTIEPAQLSLPPAVGSGDAGAPSALVTHPIEIDVLPLPQVGKPEDFTGAVGQYQIEAQVDRGTTKVGDGFSLRLQVSGIGNIETLTAPIIPAVPHMTIYPPKITDAIHEVGTTIQGSRTYTYVIVASKGGNWTIPEIEYPYFHPQEESYQIARTTAIPITVLPNPNEGHGTTDSQPMHADMYERTPDIRHIKSDALRLRDQNLLFYERPLFWALQIFPIMAALLAWFYQQQQAKRDISQLRQRRATQEVHSIIDTAEKQNRQNPVAFFSALATALYRYIGATLEISPTGLNPERVRGRCQEMGISVSTTAQLVELLAQCDYVRFAPVSVSPAKMKDALNRAKTVIDKIEKERQETHSVD